MSTRSRGAAAAASACGLAVIAVTLALVGGIGPARARSVLPASDRQSGKLPVSLVITSVSPSYAGPKEKVRVSGLVTNNSGAAISGLQIRLRSADSPFTSRDELEEYVAGELLSADTYEPGAVSRPISLGSGTTARWSVRLPVRATGMSAFGVYPLAAEADNAGGVPYSGATSRTFLPFWPGKHGQSRPQRQQIAWLFPLIGQPVQGPCPGPVLLNNSLAASVAPGGRLSSLLAAGQAASSRTHLTWVIDPSLLASVQKMTGSYQVGGSGNCLGNASKPADHAAAAWLAGLRHALTGQSVMVTPFADVDLAALTRNSLDGDLATAFTQGRLVGGQILGRDFAPVSDAALAGRGEPKNERAARALNGIAWPADGLANRAVVEDLAVNKITAVVLDSTAARSLSGGFADTAVASTLDEVNGPMRVLLADDTITQLLASANSPRVAPGTAFAVRQRFLAETAMIAAQAPNSARSIVVAPPRRWDPPAHLAAGLLAETASAPWLKPVSLGALATDSQPPGPQIQLPTGAVKDELNERLLRRLRILDRRAELLESIRANPDPTLGQAVTAAESSAWRGRDPSVQAQAMLNRVSEYISSQEQGLEITKPVPVTMGGLKGSPPVSISSHLGYPVRVRLAVRAPGDLKITVAPPGPITIPPGSVVNVKLNVHAQQVGSRTVQLSLLSPDGRPLPGTTVTMTIRATQFGTLALIILAAALGVFMIASAARAIRQGGGTPGKAGSAGQADPSQPAGSQPGTSQSADSQPGTSQPAGSHPAPSQPALSQPALSQPALSQPALSQPAQPWPAQPWPAQFGRDPGSAGRRPDGQAGDTVEADGPAQHTGPQTGHHASDAAVGDAVVSDAVVGDTAVSDTAVSDATSAGRDPTEGTDELARAPGQADRA